MDLPQRMKGPRRASIFGDQQEAGAVSVFAVLAVSILVMFVGIAVDLSGAVHATQRAQSVAREAARTGAEAANAGAAIRGAAPEVNSSAGAAAARRYLSDSGMFGSVTVSANTVTVQAQTSYQCVLLGIAGISSIQVSGRSVADLRRGLGGVER